MKKKKKTIRRKSQVMPQKSAVDTVKERESENTSFDKINRDLLNTAANEWANWQDFRDMRSRCNKYTYGEQNDDPTYNPARKKMTTEKQWIMDQGNVPFSNNLIRNKVDTVVGAYVKNQTEPMAHARDRDDQNASEMMSIALQSNWQMNKMPILLATEMEEFLISSSAMLKEVWERKDDIWDSWTVPVNKNYMFLTSTMKDPRHFDVTMVGEIADIDFNTLCSSFAQDIEDVHRLKDIYQYQARQKRAVVFEDATKKHNVDLTNFYTPRDNTLCRVFEIWTKELKDRYQCWDTLNGEKYKIELDALPKIEAENAERLAEGKEYGVPEDDILLINTTWFVDSYWYYQFLTPTGEVLREGETPYAHKSHPYTMCFYPFVNGEVHSFVEDKIDIQRSINRLKSLQDMITRHSAKGMLMISTDNIPDNMTPEQFADEYVATDGLIIYKPNAAGDMPKQVYANSSSAISTIHSMIQSDKEMLNDQGVSGAIQGSSPTSGTSAQLYALQSQNSTASLAGLLQRYSSFVEEIAKKKAKTMIQMYGEQKMISIAGNSYRGAMKYDPDVAKNTEYEFSIIQSAATPVHRMVQNDQLLEFMRMDKITLPMMLAAGDFSYADTLLQMIETEKKEAQEAQAQAMEQQPNQIPPEVAEKVQGGLPPGQPQ